MIAVESRGRLGNHMFQFAFGLAAAKRLGTTFVFDDELLRPRFRLRPWGRFDRRAGRAVRYRAARRLAPYPIAKVEAERGPDPALVLERLSDRTHYSGFFQSEEYFADVEGEVRAALQPRARFVEAFREGYSHLLRRPYVCCHIRRTDYLRFEDGVALPASWYRDALAKATPAAAVPIVFVGDDVGWARAEFLDLPRVTFEHNADVVDLLLLMHASTVIVSNSSFGWWGAWLNEQQGKRVIAPRHWFGFKRGVERPPHVLPREWAQVEVSER